MSEEYSDTRQRLPVPNYAPRPEPTIIPTAAWNDTPLFCLRVNDEWVSHILGVLAALDQPDTWIGTEEEIYTARQQVNEIMLMLMTQCEDTVSYPRGATLWHDQVTVLTGLGLETISMADPPYNLNNTFYNTITYQLSAANGDSFEQPVQLDAGNYIFYALGAQNYVHGMVDWYLDDEPTPFLAGQDWYASGVQANIIKSGSMTVATAGNHVLKGVLNGKNAASYAYVAALVKYWFEYVP